MIDELLGPALATFRQVLHHEKAPAGARVRAAVAVLDRCGITTRTGSELATALGGDIDIAWPERRW